MFVTKLGHYPVVRKRCKAALSLTTYWVPSFVGMAFSPNTVLEVSAMQIGIQDVF